jgi:hypothetical protein
MWWMRLFTAVSHLHLLSTTVKLVAKTSQTLLHSNFGLLGLDRLLTKIGF